MDKEKRIEEMAKDIPFLTLDREVYVSANEKAKRGWTLSEEDNKMIAKELVKQGYRKINENEIVISKEEYEMLVTQYKNLEIKYSNLSDNYRLCKDANETIKQHAIMARKETAEKIYTFVNSFGTHNWERFKEFIKQFGVDLGVSL